MACYEIQPKTKEYRLHDGAAKCELPLSFEGSPCPHRDHSTAHYPAFRIPGLEEPFAILIAVCDKCFDKVTKEEVLTDERWKRMRIILIEHDIEPPDKRKVKMEWIKAIYHAPTPSYRDQANSYSYAMAA